MHAKPSFAYRLQTAKMTSFRTSAQNSGPRVQNVLLERKMFYTRYPRGFNDTVQRRLAT